MELNKVTPRIYVAATRQDDGKTTCCLGLYAALERKFPRIGYIKPVGQRDKKHVFADHLELVTSFVFFKGGVIACAAPNIWLLEDTKGTGVCDRRTKLYTGLGDRDTHAVINNMRWGNDGWIYATNGYSTSPKVTNGDGTKEFGGYTAGVIRFKPDGTAFEQYSSKNSNTWGLAMTWDGQCFFTQPTCGQVLMHVALPESILAKGKFPGANSYNVLVEGQKTFPAMKWEQQAYVQIDQVGFYTAAAGTAIYEGGAWPAKWNYSYFTSEPTINIVSHFGLTPDGVSYKAQKENGREETEFMRSKDLWFRPVEARVGPDGALYVVDFYNQAVIHNDTRGPLHGPANAAIRPDRDHYFSRIWRVQHKQAKKVPVPALEKENLGALISVLEKSENAQTKGTALRLVRENFGADKIPSNVVQRTGSRAVGVYESALAEVGNAQKRGAVLEQFKDAKDVWTRSALIAAAAEAPLEMIREALLVKDGTGLQEFVAALVVPALNRENGASQLVNLAAGSPEASVRLQNIILKGIAENSAPAPRLTSETMGSLRKLLGSPATAGAVLPIVAAWDKAGELRDLSDAQLGVLLAQLGEAAAPVATRTQAAVNLLAVSRMSERVLPALSAVLLKDGSSELKQSLIEALGQGGMLEAGPLLIEAYRSGGAELQAGAFNQLLKRPEWTKLVLDGIQTGGIQVGDLGPANVARLRTHANKAVAQLANKILSQAGSPQTAEKNKVLAALTPEVEKGGGDVEKGKALFSGACATCHKIGNLGNQVGPILDGMGAHSVADLLVAIVDPNREVDPSFYAWNVVKKNGEVLVGVIGQENSSTLQLRSPAGTVEIPKDQIASRENTQRSLMPEGFDGLGAENLRHLMAFLKSTSVQTPLAAASATAAGAPKTNEPLPASGAQFPESVAPGVSRVLLVGGGSSHDFEKFFNQADSATLQAGGKFVTAYTPNAAEAVSLMAKADVLVLSANHKSFGEPDFQNALRAFADGGKGLVMVHAAAWYNWAPVTGYNRRFIGGGARSHGKGDFQVLSKGNSHPVLKGVPAEFTIYDENYRIELEPGAPVEVLAMTSVEASSNKAFPSVWVVNDPKTRIVVIALGHDNAAHAHDAYQKLLVNAVNWTAKK
ncbi:MAG: hypothetical protein EBS01_04445 [Verrucomicrobia bacterium]|nr:hypothetical protein [Verrucomicrobiota bacterium]